METRVAEKVVENQKRSLEIGIVDSMALTSIFGLFLSEVGKRFLEEIGRFFMFPIVAALSLVQGALALRQASLAKGKNGSGVRAGIEVITALYTAAAVVIGFVAATLAPVIFTLNIGLKALFNIGATAYYGYKWARSSNDDPNKTHYRESTKAHGIGSVALVLAGIAVGFVMLLFKPLFAIFGLVSGAIGMSMSLYNRYKLSKKTDAQDDAKKPLLLDAEKTEVSDAPKAKLTRSARLQQQVGARPDAVVRSNKALVVPQKIVHARRVFDHKKAPVVVQRDFAPRPITRSASFTKAG